MLVSILKMVLPLIVAFALGIIAAKTKMIDENGCNAVKAIISKIILSFVLFDAMLFANYSSDTVVIILLSVCAHTTLFFLSFFTRRAVKDRKKYFPFAVSTWEGGSIGVPLCLMIFGQSGMAKMAIFDIGCAFPIYLMIIPYLQSIEGKKPTKKEMVKIIFSSPVFDAIVAGVVLGCLGVGKALADCSFYPVYKSLITSVTGSCTFLIVFAVGYGFKLESKMLKEVVTTVAIRFVFFAAVWSIVYLIISKTMPYDRELLYVTIVAATLPTSFGISTYGKFEGNTDFMAGVVSLSTIVSLIACVGVIIALA